MSESSGPVDGDEGESGIGFVVEDDAPDKAAAGGAGPFALSVANSDGAAHQRGCPSCQLLGEPFGCVGLIPLPLPAAVEQWLVARLPDDIESLPGFLLRKAIGDYDYKGDYGRALREAELLEAPGPFTRHFGPFFRRFTVSSEQLLEEMVGAGDVHPPHALAILAHLGALTVDGKVLTALDEGALYAELVAKPELRRARTACTLTVDADDPDAVGALKRLLRALWAGFAVDAPVRIFAPPLDE